MAYLIDLFPDVLQMSAVASIVILFVLAARLLLRKAPKVFSYALWAVVLLRLLVPVALQSPVSAVPEISITGGAQINDALPKINFETTLDRVEQEDPEQNEIDAQTGHTVEPMEYLPILWVVGIGVMLLYSAVSYFGIRRKLRVVIPLRENIFIADDIRSPFVIGFLRPKIYLPCNLSEREQAYIILHEQHHIGRGDHIVKALAFLAPCVHWFNPLVWVAFILASRDMEMSCDEAVVEKLGGDIRADYSASLLTLATGRRIIAGTPLAFGEGDTKGRIRNLSKCKKPALWVMLIVGVLCAVLAFCLITDPMKANNGSTVGVTYYYGTVADRGMSVVNEGDREGRGYISIEGDDGTDRMFWLSENYTDMPEVQIGDHVMVRGRTETETGLLVTSRVEPTERTSAGTLDDAVISAILDFSWSEHDADGFQCASFVTLKRQGTSTSQTKTVTVYGLALHQAFHVENGRLTVGSGSHIPTAITFDVTQSGEYVLMEYWQPRDGSYYADDIQAKFPAFVWPDTQEHIYAQMQNCYAQAVEHYQLDTAPIIADLLDQITPKDTNFPNLDAHSEEMTYEYGEMIYYGRYTLEYCFSEFLKGGQTDLRGQIMAQLCRDILKEFGQKYEPWGREGQDWFDSFAKNARKLAEEYDIYDLREDYPGTWVLVNMTDLEGNLIDKSGPVFDTANIAAIAFLTPNAPEGVEVPAEDLQEITAWLDTFTVGHKAAEYLSPGSNSISVRITYTDGTTVENGLSTVVIDGAQFYIDCADAPQSYLDLVNSTW